MAISLEATIQWDTVANANPSTAFNIDVPSATVDVDDIILVGIVHRAVDDDGAISDDSGDSVAWTLEVGVNIPLVGARVLLYWKALTAAWESGDPQIDVTSLVNSSAGFAQIWRGVAPDDPFDAATVVQVNASGTETHPGITTVTDAAEVVMIVGASASPISMTFTPPLVEHGDWVSTAGSDVGLGVASFNQAAAGATGGLAYNLSVNRNSGVIVCALKPELGGGGVDVKSLSALGVG